jgi:hypothetical protein
MVDNLVALVNSSKTINYLVSSLKHKGIIVETNHIDGLLLRIKQVYGMKNIAIDSSHQMRPLPGREVLANGISYFVHGIVHSVPGNSVSDSYKMALKNSVANWSLLCEDGLNTEFSLQTDIFNEAQILGLTRAKSYVKNFSATMAFIGSIMADYLLGNKPPLVGQEIKTIEDLRKIRIGLFRTYLPEPLGMDILQYVYPNSTRIRRYILEVEQAICYASEKNLKELHLIVGCAHELPLEYLLSNQDKIQEFKGRMK